MEATDSPLSVNNFSFSRKVLHKPPFEVVRQAGRVGIPSKKGSPSPLKKSKQSPKLTPKTLTPNTLPRRRPGRPPKKRVLEVPEPKSQPTTKFSDVEVIIERDTDEVPLPPVEVVPKVTQQEPVTVTTAVTTTTSTPVSKNTKTVTTSSKNVVLIKQEQNIDFNISALLNSSSSVTSSPIEVDDLRKKKMVARKSTTPRPKLLKVDGMNKTPNNRYNNVCVCVFKNKIFILFIFLLMVISVEGEGQQKTCIEKSLDKFSVCQTVTSLEIDAKNKEASIHINFVCKVIQLIFLE